MLHRRHLFLGTFAGAAVAALPAIAENPYPSRPVRILIGFAPGGAVDILGRLIAKHLTDRFGVSFVVENRPGANANIAAEAVTRAAPDGYTLLMITSSHALSALTTANLPFDPVKSFTPITLVASVPNAVIIGPKVPANTLQEFIELVRKAPGKYNFASTGVGGATHLSGVAFELAAHVDMVHVPYTGAGQALNAVIGGEVTAYFGTVSGSKSYADSGMLKILAVSSDKRSPDIPNVPTAAEAGLPDYRSSSWYGMLGPPGMPAEIVRKLHDEVARAVAAQDIVARLRSDGGTAVASEPQAFARFLPEQIAQLAPVVKAADIQKH